MTKLIFATLFTYIFAPVIILVREGILPMDHVPIIGLLAFIGLLFWLRSAFVIPAIAALFSSVNGILVWTSIQGSECENSIRTVAGMVLGLVFGIGITIFLAFLTSSHYQEWHDVKKGWSRLIFLFVLLTFGPIVLIPSWSLLAFCAAVLIGFHLVVRRRPSRFETYSGGGSSPMYVARDDVPPY